MPIPAKHLEISVAEAETADAKTLHAIAMGSNIDAWSPGDYADEIKRAGSIVIKADTNGQLIGFMVARIVPGTGIQPDAEIYNIAVLAEYRRSGVGRKLLNYLYSVLTKHNVSSIWLEVRESNHSAIDFYKKFGFIIEVVRPNFYAHPSENALVMHCDLNSARDVNFP